MYSPSASAFQVLESQTGMQQHAQLQVSASEIRIYPDGTVYLVALCVCIEDCLSSHLIASIKIH